MQMHQPFIVKAMLAAQLLWLPILSSAAPAAPTRSASPGEQKIVFIRHGEKPADGLGQLDCQGLNRALALPGVLLGKFGRPDFVFAPDPTEKMVENGHSYDYVRPLLTVAPTAVQAGLPINTSFGYANIRALQSELQKPHYRDAFVLVAWEHKQIEALSRSMLGHLGGNRSAVPAWDDADFDSIYVLTIQRGGGKTSAGFTLEKEQLNGRSAMCAGAAGAKQ